MKFHENIRTTRNSPPHKTQVIPLQGHQGCRTKFHPSPFYLIHWFIPIPFYVFSNPFHFSLDFSPKQSFLSYICFFPEPQRHLSFTFPTPWTRKSLRRREAGMWVATLRTFAAMFRPYVRAFTFPRRQTSKNRTQVVWTQKIWKPMQRVKRCWYDVDNGVDMGLILWCWYDGDGNYLVQTSWGWLG